MSPDTGAELAAGRVALRDLAPVFLRIGSTCWGGAAPMLAMMQAEVVQKRGWLAQQDFTDGVTLSQVLPGPIAVDTAAYLGYRLRGWPGAVVALLALVLPSFLLMLALTLLYLQYGALPRVEGVFRGVGAVVVALILSAAYRLGRSAVRDAWSALILAAATLGLLALHANIVLIIVLAGLAGWLLYRNSAPEPAPAPERKP